MASYTENLKLKLLDKTDKFDIDDFNEDWNAIDKIPQMLDDKVTAAQEAAQTAQQIAADLSQKDFVLKLNADSSVTLVFNSERG